MTDILIESNTLVFVSDDYSEYVTDGEYTSIKETFPKASKYTIDGLVVAPNTEVIIYSKSDFEGDIILEKSGPFIINDSWLKTDSYEEQMNGTWSNSTLDEAYPISVRYWSNEITPEYELMHDWKYGSIKVRCRKPKEETEDPVDPKDPNEKI